MKLSRSISIGIAAVALAGVTLPATAAFKCWTNNEGVRECGDKVPPEYSQHGHEVIKQGIVVEETERARTPEELEEEARQAAIEAERVAAEEEKRRQDRVLLATFSTVADIERVRDEQITALEATIGVTRARNEKIREDLAKRIEAAASQERAGEVPNEALLDDIESLRRQLSANEAFIMQKHAEQDQIHEEYARRIDRFRELKGI